MPILIKNDTLNRRLIRYCTNESLNEINKDDIDLILSDFDAITIFKVYKSRGLKSLAFDIDPEMVKEDVARFCKVPVRDIISRKRNQNLVFARQMIIYVLSKYNFGSLQHIGSIVNRDHATSIHSIKEIEILLEVKRPDARYQLCKTILCYFDLWNHNKDRVKVKLDEGQFYKCEDDLQEWSVSPCQWGQFLKNRGIQEQSCGGTDSVYPDGSE